MKLHFLVKYYQPAWCLQQRITSKNYLDEILVQQSQLEEERKTWNDARMIVQGRKRRKKRGWTAGAYFRNRAGTPAKRKHAEKVKDRRTNQQRLKPLSAELSRGNARHDATCCKVSGGAQIVPIVAAQPDKSEASNETDSHSTFIWEYTGPPRNVRTGKLLHLVRTNSFFSAN